MLIDGWRLRHPAVLLAADLKPEGIVAGQLQELSQILLTLLDNAAHAVRERGGDGEIRLSLIADAARQPAKENQKTAIIRVADNGCGIAPELLPRLGDGPVDSRSGGRGIGLMLAFAAAAQMGGRLQLRSVVDEGTVAELQFPVS
jgi:two-component system sensor histidine kinase RegB